MNTPKLPIINALEPQYIEADLSNGMKIKAPVDLWISALLEIIDSELQSAWLQAMVMKIQAQQQQPPKLFIPGKG